MNFVDLKNFEKMQNYLYIYVKVWKITLEGNGYRIGNFTIIQLISGKYTREKSVVKRLASRVRQLFTQERYAWQTEQKDILLKKKRNLILSRNQDRNQSIEYWPFGKIRSVDKLSINLKIEGAHISN